MEKVKVRFVVDKITGEVVALFPNEDYGFNGYRDDLKTCYSHIGQHSSYAPEYETEKTRPAQPKEYDGLLRELKGIGYDVEIINKN
jgi:hypothetical protein